MMASKLIEVSAVQNSTTNGVFVSSSFSTFEASNSYTMKTSCYSGDSLLAFSSKLNPSHDHPGWISYLCFARNFKSNDTQSEIKMVPSEPFS
jgi:hypothetical protein